MTPESRLLQMRCPWHQEETPSLFIHRARAWFYCFGCGRGGSIWHLPIGWETEAEPVPPLLGWLRRLRLTLFHGW